MKSLFGLALIPNFLYILLVVGLDSIARYLSILSPCCGMISFSIQYFFNIGGWRPKFQNDSFGSKPVFFFNVSKDFIRSSVRTCSN